jgi:glycosyltransferase involved in cell wall biosynthesis
MIDAISMSKTEANLTIIGDGPLRADLERHASIHAPSKVKFTGLVPHAETNKYYDDADIFVLPSIRECGGAVVLEAMARGLPVIATNWGGPKDYITAETGFLIEPTSRAYMIKEFATTIDLLSAQPDLRYKVGQAAIDRIKQHFLWDKKIQDVLAVYKSLIKPSKA